MTGQELYKELQKIPLKQRKLLDVQATFWNNDDSGGSGWEEQKDIDRVKIGKNTYNYQNDRLKEAIVLS